LATRGTTVAVQPSSQFRRSGQRDDRRRRLLAEESAGPACASATETGSSPDGLVGPQRPGNYGDAAFMDETLRVYDLVPRRLSVMALLLLAALGVVTGLEALYAWSCAPGLSGLASDGKIAAFDLDGEGSLAVWFSSASLMLAAAVAVLVYTVRRHKTDDYRGYYRVWLWAALCWLAMSVDETASLHEGFMGMMTYLTGTAVYGDGSVWWVVPYFFVLGAVGSRLLVDMRTCRLSSGALLAAGGCYALAVGTQVLGDGLSRAIMLEEGAEMVGDVLLLLAMGLHARYVILDAEGLLPARQSVPAELQPPEPLVRRPATEGDWVSVDRAHCGPRPVAPSRTATAPPEPADSPVRRKLTKAEKKALRERLIRQRLARQRQ
jgi:hypothetical protein